MEEITIRPACESDAAALLAIYEPYVLHTAITFEYDVPTLHEFTRRITAVSARYPYLVAEAGGSIVGYAYASEFKARAAYQYAVETSIYVAQNSHRRGIGKALYTALRQRLAAQGILNMNACISYPCQPGDPYLTLQSVRFHEKMGFTRAAHFHKCGRKFSRWYDMIWMELLIGPHT